MFIIYCRFTEAVVCTSSTAGEGSDRCAVCCVSKISVYPREEAPQVMESIWHQHQLSSLARVTVPGNVPPPQKPLSNQLHSHNLVN